MIPIKENINFLSYRKRSFVTNQVFDILGDKYLKNSCQPIHDKRYSYYLCEKDFDPGNLNITFKKWQLSLPSNILFKIHDDGKKELILYHKDNFEKILLGRSILLNIEMVYDYANKEIGFYSPNYVKFIDEFTNPIPPKIYEFLEDDTTFKPTTIIENKPNLIPNAEPEDEEDKTYKDVDEGEKWSLLGILKLLLSILIVLIGLFILGFLSIYAMKYRNKQKIKKTKEILRKEKLMNDEIKI